MHPFFHFEKNIKNIQNKGFTIVEVLVSVGIFVVVMVIIAGSLLSIVNANRRSYALKAVMDNIASALETVLRQARVGTTYSCLENPIPEPDDCPSGSVFFSHVDGYDNTGNNRIYYKYDVDAQALLYRNAARGMVTWQRMTSDQVRITNMLFSVSRLSDSAQQRRVVITLSGTVGQGNTALPFNIMTSAVQRLRQENF